jgi:hypothetical protein
MPIIQRPSGALNLRKDVGGFSCPDEGFRGDVMAVDIFVNGSNQILDAAKDTATIEGSSNSILKSALASWTNFTLLPADIAAAPH